MLGLPSIPMITTLVPAPGLPGSALPPARQASGNGHERPARRRSRTAQNRRAPLNASSGRASAGSWRRAREATPAPASTRPRSARPRPLWRSRSAGSAPDNDRPHSETSTSCRRAFAGPCTRRGRCLRGRQRSVYRHRGHRRAPSPAMSRIPSGVARRKPRMRWPWRNSSTMSSGTTSPACAPQVANRPSAAIAARRSPTGASGRVDHGIDAAAVGGLGHRFRHRRVAVAVDHVGAQCPHRVGLLGRSHRGDHARPG